MPATFRVWSPGLRWKHLRTEHCLTWEELTWTWRGHLLMKRCEQTSSLGLYHAGGGRIYSSVQCSLLEIISSLISWLNHWYNCFSGCFRQMRQVLLFFSSAITAWEVASCQACLTAIFTRPYESQCHHLQLMSGQTELKRFVQVYLQTAITGLGVRLGSPESMCIVSAFRKYHKWTMFQLLEIA